MSLSDDTKNLTTPQTNFIAINTRYIAAAISNISKATIESDSPALGEFSRCSITA